MVLDRLDYGFDQAKRFGLACCISEVPWARRYRGLPKDDAVEYNTGVMFFTARAKPVFDRWVELAPQIDATVIHVIDGQVHTAPFQDQGAFVKAVAGWDQAPFVLPLNWNFRPMFCRCFCGPIKIWHDYSDAPPRIRQLADYYRRRDSVIQFHGI